MFQMQSDAMAELKTDEKEANILQNFDEMQAYD